MGSQLPLLLSEWVGELRMRRRDPSSWSNCPSGWMMTFTARNSSSTGGDVIILPTEASARVHLVFGLGFHKLLKHEQERVSRIAELERVPGQSDSQLDLE